MPQIFQCNTRITINRKHSVTKQGPWYGDNLFHRAPDIMEELNLQGLWYGCSYSTGTPTMWQNLFHRAFWCEGIILRPDIAIFLQQGPWYGGIFSEGPWYGGMFFNMNSAVMYYSIYFKKNGCLQLNYDFCTPGDANLAISHCKYFASPFCSFTVDIVHLFQRTEHFWR